MKYLSIINFIRYYVDDFCCDLVSNRKDYVRICRNLVKRVENIYLCSSNNDDFICRLYDELLCSRNERERKLFSGLISEVRRLREYDIYC